MDPGQFDTLVRSLGHAATRRGALAALLAGLVGPLVPDLAGAKRGRGKDRGGDGRKQRHGGDGAAGGRQDRGKGKTKDRENARGKARHRKQRDSDAAEAVVKAGGECRDAGHPCEGNQQCCANLICVVSGLGAASRCTPCGDSGERCCANSSCSAGHVCTADDQCIACGADGQRCCADDACGAEDLVCNPATGLCVPCGDDGELCCAGGSCDRGFTCAGGHCVPCGGDSEACCDGESCDGRFVCDRGACVACGGAVGQSCCDEGPACDDGLTCQGNTCVGCVDGDCRHLDDPCNRGVCQPDGSCAREPRDDDEFCLAGANFCTDVGACRNGSCVTGPAVVCTAADACHVAGVCDPDTGRCSNPEAANGTACGNNGQCQNGRCVEPCLPLQAVCDPATDICCDSEGEFCSETAACRDGGEPGRCCRPEGAFCTAGCDCCEGVCAGGVCCQPNRQCNDSSECCEGYNCVDNVCEAACGTDRALCGGGMGTAPCCDGFRCFEGECWPGTCLAPTEHCSSANQCCPEGIVACESAFDSGGPICCHPFNTTCRETDECCGINICGPQSKCCRPTFGDPDRGGESSRGCIGREHECCPGTRCKPTSGACCVEEGQPVPTNSLGFIDCCHFAERDGVCVCHRKGETCSAPTGNPFLSTCCDGLICLNGVCNSPCNPFYLDPALPCCIGCTHDENTGICDCP
jgi:hypothetical protein